jgi:2-dehydro-3-deoxyphosphogluconate aldolase/(4S)-4-hydroxy-2-oxoglutarate aldolase
MARFTRLEIVQLMEETGLVPLFYSPDINLSKKVLKACYDGGARLLEFTARGDFAYKVFEQLNLYALEKLPGLALGVGSITDAASASLYIQMGANFIVTPSLRTDIAKICNRRKILWSPGCSSLTEINSAEELGCEVVKLFPGSVLGPEFVKAIKGPQPWTKVMPTGGVNTNKDNLQGWFDSGVTCVGMGSKLISKKIIENEDYKLLETTVRDTLKIIRELKVSGVQL